MYQKTIEELYQKVVIEKEAAHRALRNTTLVVIGAEYHIYFDALSEARDDAESYGLNADEERKIFIHYLIETYMEHYADDQLDMDLWLNDMYGYYDLEDGSELREGRICLSRMRKATDWETIVRK